MRIFGGRVVTPDGVREADVVVADGRIAALEAPTGGGDLDARGCVVLPGGVDPHTHPLPDLAAATLAAARGGTTTVLAFTAPRPGEPAAAAFARARDELLPAAHVHVRLHPAIWEPERLDAGELDALVAEGARSVKLYLAYPELGMLPSDRKLYETLRDAARRRLLVQVHCESPGAIAARIDEALAEGRTDARAFAWTRPPLVEQEGVARTLFHAQLADAPVYLVHLTTAGSLELVREARRHGQTVRAEVCTHHLVLDSSRYDGDEPERFVTVPPLRDPADVDALWEGIADGTVDAIGSDHAQQRYRPDHPPGDFRAFAYGVYGIDVRVPLALSEGMRRGIPLARLADLLAGGPARAFGLAPAKGEIAAGADADLVVWDPSSPWTIESDTPFRGLEVGGTIRRVLLGGVEVG